MRSIWQKKKDEQCCVVLILCNDVTKTVFLQVFFHIIIRKVKFSRKTYPFVLVLLIYLYAKILSIHRSFLFNFLSQKTLNQTKQVIAIG